MDRNRLQPRRRSSDENQKLNLEIEKLKSEIYYLKTPFKNPANIAPFATLLAAAFGIIWGISSGWFGLQSDLLKREKKILEIDIKEFAQTKKGLEDSIEVYKVAKLQLYDSLVRINQLIIQSSIQMRKLDLVNKQLNEKIISLAEKKNIQLEYAAAQQPLSITSYPTSTPSWLTNSPSNVISPYLSENILSTPNPFTTSSLSKGEGIITTYLATLSDFKIKGRVIDEMGKPIEGAMVRQSFGISQAVQTDANGYFVATATGTKGSSVVLQAFKAGYVSDFIQGYTTLGSEQEIHIKMKAEQMKSIFGQ